MWYVYFKTANRLDQEVVARLEKGYSTKGNATKYAKKNFGVGVEYIVAQENPFAVKKG